MSQNWDGVIRPCQTVEYEGDIYTNHFFKAKTLSSLDFPSYSVYTVAESVVPFKFGLEIELPQ